MSHNLNFKEEPVEVVNIRLRIIHLELSAYLSETGKAELESLKEKLKKIDNGTK